MKPLSTSYAKEMQERMRANPSRVVTFRQIFSLFGKAFEQAATISTANNGFAKTGIWPYNPDHFSSLSIELF